MGPHSSISTEVTLLGDYVVAFHQKTFSVHFCVFIVRICLSPVSGSWNHISNFPTTQKDQYLENRRQSGLFVGWWPGQSRRGVYFLGVRVCFCGFLLLRIKELKNGLRRSSGTILASERKTTEQASTKPWRLTGEERWRKGKKKGMPFRVRVSNRGL